MRLFKYIIISSVAGHMAPSCGHVQMDDVTDDELGGVPKHYINHFPTSKNFSSTATMSHWLHVVSLICKIFLGQLQRPAIRLSFGEIKSRNARAAQTFDEHLLRQTIADGLF